jgi:Flp pilus assembly protein CpaB
MSRLGSLDRLREHWLASCGLALALIALALGLTPGSGEPETAVLALRHSVAAGAVVRAGDVVAVRIASSDRTPSMLTGRLGVLAGRRTAIDLAGGDFLQRGALRAGGGASLLRRGERAVALEVASASAPDLRLLRPGRRVDVVVVDGRGTRVAARGLELLSPAIERSGGIAVTLRAPARLALALSEGRPGADVRLLLRGEAP